MNDWLSNVVESSAVIPWDTVLIRLIMALILGLLITAIYHASRYSSGTAGAFPTTLVLLCVLIAMVTQVIGDDVARAFSLVGALSIVRFRTVVRDTKDTAFVIFAVVVGMAVGAGQPIVAICGMVVIGAAATILRDRPRNMISINRETTLTLRYNWSEALEAKTLEAVAKYAAEVEQLSVVTVRHGAAMDLTYRVLLHATTKPTELVADLNRIEGIQTIELQAQRPAS